MSRCRPPVILLILQCVIPCPRLLFVPLLYSCLFLYSGTEAQADRSCSQALPLHHQPGTQVGYQVFSKLASLTVLSNQVRMINLRLACAEELRKCSLSLFSIVYRII